jgi:hypothetical protein
MKVYDSKSGASYQLTSDSIDICSDDGASLFKIRTLGNKLDLSILCSTDKNNHGSILISPISERRISIEIKPWVK